MFRKALFGLTLVCHVWLLSGCYSMRQIQPDQFEPRPEDQITKVVTVDGEVIMFETKPEVKATIVDNNIEGYLKRPAVQILLSQVKTIYAQKPDGRQIPPEPFQMDIRHPNPRYPIVEVITLAGESFEFETKEGLQAFVKGSMIMGYEKAPAQRIPLSQVAILHVKRYDQGKTMRSCCLMTGIPLLVLSIIVGIQMELER